MTPVVVTLMALIAFWLWLYFAALLWDGLGGRWAQKSERGRLWFGNIRKNPFNARRALELVVGAPYHAIWLRPGYSFAISFLLLVILSYLLLWQ